MTGDLPRGWTALELGRRQEGGGIALVGLDLVGQAQLFKQPDDALGQDLFRWCRTIMETSTQ